jgi:uncharacterized membrane protein
MAPTHTVFYTIDGFLASTNRGRAGDLSKSRFMYLKCLMLLNLIGFAVIASQPLFYLLALTDSQKKLRAPAYIELRKLLDKNLRIKLKVFYYATLLTAVLLTVLTFSPAAPLRFITASIALCALIADIAISLKRNVPINNLINNWDADAYPRHWQLIRRKWFYFYKIRQAIGIVGFISLLVGVVFG